MRRWVVFPVGALVAAASALATVSIGAAADERVPAPMAAPGPARPAYLERGDAVEARYERYRERLARFFEEFSIRLAEEPDLRAKLEAAPPAPVVYGYQIVPKLVPAPAASGPPRLSASYGWTKTAGYVDRDLGRLVKLETELGQADEPAKVARHARWEKMVEEYRKLAANQKLIASHVEYNRLWQAEIARNRRGYDEQTDLQDAVFQRQGLLAALAYPDPVLARYLRARAEELGVRIGEAARRLNPPDWVAVEEPSPGHFVFTVPVYTDIEDDAFVDGFRAAVETLWQARSDDGEFSVKILMRKVPESTLYPDGGGPKRGEHVALDRHVARFPPRGAVLTTGGNSTYVLGRAINVGPPDIHPNIAAHEFGHILGFVDGYFRGYRDRGPEGFEVLEAVTDPDDIMSAPGEGRVRAQHFQRLLEAVRSRRS